MNKVRKGTPTYIGLKRKVATLESLSKELVDENADLISRNLLLELRATEDTDTIRSLRRQNDNYINTNDKLRSGNDSLRAQLGVHERIMDWTARLFGKYADTLPPLVLGSGEHLKNQRERRDFVKERSSRVPRREAKNYRAQQEAHNLESFKPGGTD